VAAVVPGAPGGAGAAIKAGRAADVAADGARAVSRASPKLSRKLQASDLGIEGSLSELDGVFAVEDGIASIRVDMIRGEIQNPMQVIGNMMETAKSNGATSLRIEGTIANERLFHVLQRRYGLTSKGSMDSITIQLE
jgi:hypothetical protein